MLLPEAAVVRVRSRLPSPAASTSAHVWAPSSLFTHLSCPCYLEVLHVVRSTRPPSGIQYVHQILCADCSSGIERIARGMPRANDAGQLRSTRIRHVVHAAHESTVSAISAMVSCT